MKSIGVIGAGLMGHGIAQLFAYEGFRVILQDINEDILSKALEQIYKNLSFLSEKGFIDKDKIEPTLGRIKVTLDLENVTTEADFIFESITENLGLKQELFQRLEELAPSESIFATNTSVLRVSEVAQRVKKKERVIGTHFWNPPYLVPLVEVTPCEGTSEEVVEITINLLKFVGKYPVRVKKDVPGFIGNRLQHALWREAISLVEKGIADPETIDDVIKNSFGIRLAILGPLENADMVGLDLTLSIHEYIFKYLEDSKKPSSLLREKVEKGELGFKTKKGFRTWDGEKMERLKNDLLEYLIEFQKGRSS